MGAPSGPLMAHDDAPTITPIDGWYWCNHQDGVVTLSDDRYICFWAYDSTVMVYDCPGPHYQLAVIEGGAA